jgi:hypothetical protein
MGTGKRGRKICNNFVLISNLPANVKHKGIAGPRKA